MILSHIDGFLTGRPFGYFTKHGLFTSVKSHRVRFAGHPASIIVAMTPDEPCACS